MENSKRPQTAEFAEKMRKLCDGPPTFYNLDVATFSSDRRCSGRATGLNDPRRAGRLLPGQTRRLAGRAVGGRRGRQGRRQDLRVPRFSRRLRSRRRTQVRAHRRRGRGAAGALPASTSPRRRTSAATAGTPSRWPVPADELRELVDMSYEASRFRASEKQTADIAAVGETCRNCNAFMRRLARLRHDHLRSQLLTRTESRSGGSPSNLRCGVCHRSTVLRRGLTSSDQAPSPGRPLTMSHRIRPTFGRRTGAALALATLAFAAACSSSSNTASTTNQAPTTAPATPLLTRRCSTRSTRARWPRPTPRRAPR